MEEVQEGQQTQLEQLSNTEQRIPLTCEEFLTSFDDTTHAEWANGEAIVFMPPSIRHQDIVIFLSALLAGFVKIFRLGKVLSAPCAMRLMTTNTVREPDIMFLETANFGRQSENRIDGPADLVVEVISTERIARDRGDKFYEYQENGVREYWIIDPRPGKLRADFWVLNESGTFRAVPLEKDGSYLSTVLPNFRLNVNELLTDEILDPIQALVDMVGIESLSRSRNHSE